MLLLFLKCCFYWFALYHEYIVLTSNYVYVCCNSPSCEQLHVSFNLLFLQPVPLFAKIEESKATELRKRFSGKQVEVHVRFHDFPLPLSSPLFISLAPFLFYCWLQGSDTGKKNVGKSTTRPAASSGTPTAVSLSEEERVELQQQLDKQVWYLHVCPQERGGEGLYIVHKSFP